VAELHRLRALRRALPPHCGASRQQNHSRTRPPAAKERTRSMGTSTRPGWQLPLHSCCCTSCRSAAPRSKRTHIVKTGPGSFPHYLLQGRRLLALTQSDLYQLVDTKLDADLLSDAIHDLRLRAVGSWFATASATLQDPVPSALPIGVWPATPGQVLCQGKRQAQCAVRHREGRRCCNFAGRPGCRGQGPLHAIGVAEKPPLL
jgi:hypothetical protein